MRSCEKLKYLKPGLPPSESKLRGSLVTGDTGGMFVTQGRLELLWSKLLPTQQLATTLITCFSRPEVPVGSISSLLESHGIETKVSIS